MKTIHSLTMLLLVLVSGVQMGAQPFNISWFSVDGGSGTSMGGAFTVSGTIGQPDAGAISGGSYDVQGGFWPGVQLPLSAYDGFDYPSLRGPLLGASGGTGFSDAWHPGGFNATVSNNYAVVDGSLIAPGVQRAGNRIQTASAVSICGLARSLSQTLGVPGTTHYLSVILRPEGTLNQGAFNGFFGVYLNASSGVDLFVGKPGGGALNRYVLENRGGSGQVSSSYLPVVGSNVLLVVRCEFFAGPDRFTLYINPPPGDAPPASGTVKFDSDVGTVNGVTIYSTGAFSLDELRLAETYAAAVPACPDGPAPFLSVGSIAARTIVLRWSDPSGCYVLQQTANMNAPGGGWMDVTQPPVINGSNKEVTLSATGAFCMFRLRLE